MREPMPRALRSRSGERVPLLALLFGAASFLASCDGQLAFDSPLSGAGGSVSAAGAGGDGNRAGAGNAAGSNLPPHGPESCTTDIDCGLPELHCQPFIHQCVECLSNQQCPAERPACSQSTLRCVACDGSTACPVGQVCDLQSDKCLTRCHTDANCNDALNQYCDLNGLCATCDGNEDCIPKLGGTICQRSASECVQCLEDDQCGGLTPRCLLPTGKCVACVDSRDCASTAPYCDPTLNQCSAAAL